MKPPQRLMDLVLGVAQIDSVDVGGNLALDHIEVVGVDLFVQRRPGAIEIGVVARAKRCLYRRKALDFHRRPHPASRYLYISVPATRRLCSCERIFLEISR